MKPIKLKVKGLNSFIEEQEIDFEKLSKNGFFGIFGPTGSGKSTILDGITLALYGEESRKSADYINSNCDNAYVQFEFQISGKEVKRYVVEREFKRDKKTLKPRTGKCKIVDVTGEISEVLEESVSGVNNKCAEIIGLTKDDFSRTVVLPQGKFSEFLKMEGKNRSDMLERLFNLYEYGEVLSEKLKRAIISQKNLKLSYEGELVGLGEFSEEELKIKELDYKNKESMLDDALKTFEVLKIKYDKSKQIFELQEELNSFSKQAETLNDKKEAIEELKIKANNHKQANNIASEIEEYESILNEKTKLATQLSELADSKQISTFKELEHSKIYESSKKAFESELPELRKKEQKISDAILEYKQLEKLELELSQLEIELEKINININNEKEALIVEQTKLSELENFQADMKDKLEFLRIDDEYKEAIRRGQQIEESIESIQIDKNKIEEKLNQLNREDTVLNNQFKEFSKLKNDMESEFKKSQEKLEADMKNSPGTRKELDLRKEEYLRLETNFEKYNLFKLEDQKLQESLLVLGKIDIDTTFKVEQLNNEILKVIDEMKNIELQNLANKLRTNLSDGDICPVCGSKERHIENIEIIDTDDMEKYEKEKNIKLDELKSLEIKLSTNKFKLGEVKNKIIENNDLISTMGTDFSKINLESETRNYQDFERLVKEFEENRLQDEEALRIKEKNLLIKQNEIDGILINLKNIKTQIDDYQNDFKRKKESFEYNKLELDNIIKLTNVANFSEKLAEIKLKEKEKTTIEYEIDNNLNEQKVIQISIKNSNEKIVFKSNSKIELETSIFHKKELKNSIDESLKSKFEVSQNLEILLNETNKEINLIENQYKKSELEYKNVRIELQKINDLYLVVLQNMNNIDKQYETRNFKIKQLLIETNFISIEEVKLYIIDKFELLEIEKEIVEYEEALSKLNTVIETITVKLKNETITDIEWQNIQSEKKQKEIMIDSIKNDLILLNKEIEDIRYKINSIAKVLNKIKEIDKKLGVLAELEGLFKGKKFVQFIAKERLNYISKEASIRLLEITNGVYGIETDDEGRFLIRDNKNGGVLREASTLSGGETFIASLALALSLSAEIQLKGTAPLELFFLDEGFGTLDDEVLEVLMSSLEKIHNDKLKIGIISHVESIKNRVPIKLLVTPAKSGEGGSRVKIELN